MKPCKNGFRPFGLNPKSCKEKKDFLTELNLEISNLSVFKFSIRSKSQKCSRLTELTLRLYSYEENIFF